MKFATVDGERREAEPGLSAVCPACDHPVVAKCGEIKVWHWAHRVDHDCDPWREGETEWHRAWKDKFPAHWQEVVQKAETGEKHVADVKTDRGWVIEFQHSHLKPEERRSRNAFYSKLIWVVDATRRVRDAAQVLEAWSGGLPTRPGSPVRRAYMHECALLREWGGSGAPVFFDVGEAHPLWWLFASSADGTTAYLAPYSRAQFIEDQRGEVTASARDFDQFVKDAPKLIAEFEAQMRTRPVPPPNVFQPHMGRGGRGRRRF